MHGPRRADCSQTGRKTKAVQISNLKADLRAASRRPPLVPGMRGLAIPALLLRDLITAVRLTLGKLDPGTAIRVQRLPAI